MEFALTPLHFPVSGWGTTVYQRRTYYTHDEYFYIKYWTGTGWSIGCTSFLKEDDEGIWEQYSQSGLHETRFDTRRAALHAISDFLRMQGL